MPPLPPLCITLLFHPKSEHGRDVAFRLFSKLVAPPLSGGLRLPVYFGPDLGDDMPPAAPPCSQRGQRSITVILADKRMARQVGDGTGGAWRAYIEEMLAAQDAAGGAHVALPVALDNAAFGLGKVRRFLHAVQGQDLPEEAARERQLSEISLHVGALGLQLLKGDVSPDVAPGEAKAPITLFISHAKADLAKDKDDPAHHTMRVLTTLPIEHWFDSANIPVGGSLEDAISEGVADASVVVAFHTDQYGSRPWCRREVLEAKKVGAQFLLVDALQDQVPRHFPYLGNVPIVHWNDFLPDISARRVVDSAVLEALREKYNSMLLRDLCESEDVVLSAPPEALTLAHHSEEAVFLYPDPPLDNEEIDLLKRLRPNATFVTPLYRLVEEYNHVEDVPVAVSISTSNDLARYGLSESHVRTLTDEIHLYLLLAGVRVAYGGMLQGGVQDPDNFTLRLFELVRGYAQLGARLGEGGVRKILNIPPWPLHKAYGDAELDLFETMADLDKGPEPELPWDWDEVFPPVSAGWRFEAKTSQQRYAWARGLTSMREYITQETSAKIVIGGNLRSFQGVVPGVVEECWMSLRIGAPLYLVGAFGGCALAVIDQLQLGDRPEFKPGYAEAYVPSYTDTVAWYAKHGVQFTSMVEMGQRIFERGKMGLAAALNNGLDDDENRELTTVADPMRVAALILRGLANLTAGATNI